MLHYTATTLLRISYILTAVWLTAASSKTPAYADTYSTIRPITFQLSADGSTRNGLQCVGRQAEKWICGHGPGNHGTNFFDELPLFRETPNLTQSDEAPPRADLLVIGLLAVEEFNLLSGLRVYWERTERYVEKLSIKLRLKGEVDLSETRAQTERLLPAGAPPPRRIPSAISSKHGGVLALFKPQTIRWNLGINPQDLNVFIDLQINPHLSFNGEFGDENQMGIYFKIPF